MNRYRPYLTVGIASLLMATAISFFLSNIEKGNNPRHLSPIDIGFAQSMLIHHGQAIELSFMMQQSESQSIRSLANSIIVSQTKESGMYQGWLTMQGESVMAPANPMAWVTAIKQPSTLNDRLYQDRCRAANGQMPGIPTNTQVETLKQLSGEARDKFYLDLMIAHHQAALPMAEFARNNGSSTLTRGAAWAVISEQRREIALMQRLSSIFLSQTDKAKQG